MKKKKEYVSKKQETRKKAVFLKCYWQVLRKIKNIKNNVNP